MVSKSNPKVTDYLLDLGLPLNPSAEEDTEEYTPMMLAPRSSPFPGVIKALIVAVGNPGQKDDDGNAAFEGLFENRILWLSDAGPGGQLRKKRREAYSMARS